MKTQSVPWQNKDLGKNKTENKTRYDKNLFPQTVMNQVLRQMFTKFLPLHHEKNWAGRSTNWNQNFWEKYQ